MSGPRISVVIPTYNRRELVSRAIESVRHQTRAPEEILVVDDGSTDGTLAILAGQADVRSLHQDRRGGAAARNHGAREATGDWIALLDSDDVWEATHLERMAAAIEATEGAADFYFDDADRPAATQWELAGFSIDGDWSLSGDATDWVMLDRQPMMLQSSVVRRTSLLAAGGLSERLIRRHDTQLFFRLGLGGAACAVAGCGCRITADDVSPHRLTTAFDGASRVYWDSSALMFAEALAWARERSPAAVPELRRRLAGAHWRLSRLAWSEGRFGVWAIRALRSLGAEPTLLLRRRQEAPSTARK